MAITASRLNEQWTKEWRQKNLYGASKIAVLFPNLISETDGQFKKKVHIPIVSAPVTQADYGGETGFTETYVKDSEFAIELTQNYTLYNRLDKLDQLAPNWGTAKQTAVQNDQAQTLDKFVLATLAGTTNLVVNPVKITSDNISEILTELKRRIKKDDGDPARGILFADYAVIGFIQKLDNTSGAKAIEGSGATVISARGFQIVECDLSELKQQMVFANTSALGWALYQHTALQAGTYTQGKYLGQSFVAQNSFYNAVIGAGLEKLIVGYPEVTAAKLSSPQITPTQAAELFIKELQKINENILRIRADAELENGKKVAKMTHKDLKQEFGETTK